MHAHLPHEHHSSGQPGKRLGRIVVTGFKLSHRNQRLSAQLHRLLTHLSYCGDPAHQFG
jgi:hypothetical protein